MSSQPLLFLIRTDVESHVATHKHSAAALAMRTRDTLLTERADYQNARAATLAAQGNFLRLTHFFNHTLVSSFLGST